MSLSCRLSRLRLTTLVTLFALGTTIAQAEAPFKGDDYSGTYDCLGKDAHEGPYAGTVKLNLVREQSTGNKGAYRFTLEVPGYGAYPGHAAAVGRQMAIYFALTDPEPRDYGTGLASFSKTPAGKWRFEKFYYEPEFKGGNHGTEVCVQR